MHLETTKAMQDKYELEDDGLTDCSAFIGMNPTWAPWINGQRAQCAIDMPNKLDALLKAYDFGVARATYTPAVPSAVIRHDKPIPEGPEGDAERARVAEFQPKSFTGLALWIMRGCRPVIAYQGVGALTRVTHCFNDEHIAAARHLLRYLRTTRDLQLVCTRNPDRTNRQPEVPKFGLTPTTALTTAAGRATTAAPPHGLWSLTEQPSAGARDVNSASHSLRRSLSTTQLQKQLKKRHAYGRFTTTWGT
jgi:hypothetical protein